MHNKIKLLIELQDYDLKINEIKKRKEKIPEKIRAISEKLEKVKEELETASANLKLLKRRRREAERDLDDIEEKIRRSNEKLANIKTNKEYRAALKEIDELQEEKAKIEDRLLEIMETIESEEERTRRIQERIKEEERLFEQEKKEILKEEKELEDKIKILKKKREELAQKIQQVDGNLLKKYDFLRMKKGGIAVSPVIKGVCQACHLGIPPQKFNELIKGETIMTCPHCLRIIYWGDDARLKSEKEEGALE